MKKYYCVSKPTDIDLDLDDLMNLSNSLKIILRHLKLF